MQTHTHGADEEEGQSIFEYANADTSGACVNRSHCEPV